MFNPFKKQTVDKNKTEEKSEKEVEKNEMEERIEKELAIHTMPAHFRLDSAKISQAKTTGIVVMIVGVIFIIAIAVLAYMLIFKGNNQDAQIPVENVPLVQENQTPPVEDNTAGTLTPILPDNNLPATTTPDDIINEEATSTPEISINPAVDNDNDGLTAKEETLLGLNDKNADTDGDSYLDLSELNSFYDPASPGKLLDNINIGKYENRTFAYSMLYPLAWARTAVGGNDSIIFRSPDNSFIQIIVQPNADKQSVDDWYMEQFGINSINPAQKISSDSWSGIKNESGSIVYLADLSNNYIFVLSYNSDSGDIASYKNIFNMMVKSLVMGE